MRSFPRRTVLFLQDEPATRFFVVLDGWVKLFRETAGGEESSTLRRISQGDEP